MTAETVATETSASLLTRRGLGLTLYNRARYEDFGAGVSEEIAGLGTGRHRKIQTGVFNLSNRYGKPLLPTQMQFDF